MKFEIFGIRILFIISPHSEEQDISRLNFADVFTPNGEMSMTQANINSGFRVTGKLPFHPLELT